MTHEEIELLVQERNLYRGQAAYWKRLAREHEAELLALKATPHATEGISND